VYGYGNGYGFGLGLQDLPDSVSTNTLLVAEKCKSAPKQSIETHSAWYLIPPQGTEGVNWDVFPEDIEFAHADGNGFRGFIVEFYNVISG
jgi:hypothetical protein